MLINGGLYYVFLGGGFVDQIKIGKFIAKSRKNKKFTQEQLAEKLSVSNRTISRWETGKNMPDVSLFESLCDELDITINELLYGEKIVEDDVCNISEINLLEYSKYLKSKSRNKNIIFTVFVILVIGISILVLLLAFNKTFLKKVYYSDFHSNVVIAIPEYTYNRSTNGVESHVVKLKTLKQIDEVNVFIDNYLSAFKEIECGENIYYYNQKEIKICDFFYFT